MKLHPAMLGLLLLSSCGAHLSPEKKANNAQAPSQSASSQAAHQPATSQPSTSTATTQTTSPSAPALTPKSTPKSAPASAATTPEPKSYLACGCGCCGSGESSPKKCVYHSKGPSMSAIIKADKEANKNPGCRKAGCSQGTKYEYCD